MAAAPAELSIVVPTYNESGNVEEVVRRVDAALAGVAWEVIFVDDDSPDGTAFAVRRLGQTDARVRSLRRIGRRGLSSACVEGMLASNARFIAVMDADLQHDPAVLPTMLRILRDDAAELVVGSRYIQGASVGEWSSRRLAVSRFAAALSTFIMHQPISDPMSGYFMLKTEILDACVRKLSTLGFKILMDIVSSSGRALRIAEVPIRFGSRRAGQSKLSGNVIWEHLLLIADKLVGAYVPVRFLSFALIGAAGAIVHFLTLITLFRLLGVPFPVGQAGATAVALIFNFSVNNVLTYTGQTLRGWSWIRGLASFALACGIGALANVGVASFLYGRNTPWQLSALAGIALSAVWNYAVTARYTWRTVRQ
ncbi:MAG: glycosyltransferase family 2 protein [Burkholderiaceae bacterium]|nr:glycosyltransferase family 2 protein [Burkholderiaceae bacterium]